ncbi:MAG: hypothetical protein U0572_12940 [Phycisphaerales bacterium]
MTDQCTTGGPIVYAGIDEAGYGPLLGPLSVAVSVFVVEDVESGKAPNLWHRLRSVVSDTPSDRAKIAIADSKKLKGARDGKAHPLRHLEKGVLAALATTGTIPATDDELFDALCARADRSSQPPWYATPLALPLAHDRDAIAIAANRLRVAGLAAGVRLASLACETLDGAAFNALAEKCQKSDINFAMAMRHVDRVWREHALDHPRVVIDRHGGRVHYRAELQTAFPDARLAIVGETESISRYRMTRGDSELTISFEVESESRHLPNALASMTAKYVRELFMERMNRFFRGHLPELKPTAGYVEDGRRYVKDIRPLLARLAIDDRAIVRCR